MNLRAVVDFVNKGRVSARYVLPAVGHKGNPKPCLAAKSDGSKLALVVANLPFQDGDYGVVTAFVREIVARPVADRVRLVVDSPFPDQAIDIEKIPEAATERLAEWDQLHSDYDDNEAVQRDLTDRLAFVPEPDYPLLKSEHKFVRWSEWDPEDGGLAPRGVLLLRPSDHRVIAIPFTGHEAAAERWSKFVGVPDNFLDTLPEHAGRTTRLSVPETIKAAGWEDARQRALHKFGAEYYAETGRTMFP